MENLKNKNIIFIAPVFYDYHNQIIDHLNRKGANVTFFPERRTNLFYRFYYKFSNKLLNRYQKKYYETIAQNINHDVVDYLFVIRGCQMPNEFIAFMKLKYPSIICIMYQWDSEKSNNFIHLKDCFDKLFTFDINDSIQYSLKYLPLFYTDDLKTICNVKKEVYKYDFFSLSLYTYERYLIVSNLSVLLKNYNVFFQLYIPYTRYLKEMLMGRKLSKKILIFNPLNRSQYLSKLEESKVVIDITHTIQSGLPIRIIESLAAGKTIISTNQLIVKEFNSLGNVFVLTDSTNFKNILYDSKSESQINENYSLDKWLDVMFL